MNITAKASIRRLGLLCLCFLFSACAELPSIGDTQSSLDASINAQLDEACPLPDSGASKTEKLQLRLIRGQIILAAIAGYADTSIASYSSAPDIKSDSALVVEKLKIAKEKLVEFGIAVKADNNLFEFYRADLIIAAGGAADAALRPTLRTVKATVSVPSLSLDTVKRSKQLLLNILRDELYLEAIKKSCNLLDPSNMAPQWKFATQRYAMRCAPLAESAKLSAADYCSEPPWPFAATDGNPALGSSVAAAIPHVR
jgi:hypothetical protein